MTSPGAGASPTSAFGRRQQLRTAGLRATGPRLAVLGALQRAPGHHTAHEVAQLVADDGEQVARMSIYNALESLVSAGLVLRADAGPGATLYELATEFHHHFVCRQCGEVSDVPCAAEQKPCLDALVPGAEIDEAQVIFRGRCRACLRGKRPASRNHRNGQDGRSAPRPSSE